MATAGDSAAGDLWESIYMIMMMQNDDVTDKENSHLWCHQQHWVTTATVLGGGELTCLRGNHLLVAHGDGSMQDESHTTHGCPHCPTTRTHTHTHTHTQTHTHTHTHTESIIWSIGNRGCVECVLRSGAHNSWTGSRCDWYAHHPLWVIDYLLVITPVWVCDSEHTQSATGHQHLTHTHTHTHTWSPSC